MAPAEAHSTNKMTVLLDRREPLEMIFLGGSAEARPTTLTSIPAGQNIGSMWGMVWGSAGEDSAFKKSFGGRVNRGCSTGLGRTGG